jgi:hypothetical protein
MIWIFGMSGTPFLMGESKIDLLTFYLVFNFLTNELPP